MRSGGRWLAGDRLNWFYRLQRCGRRAGGGEARDIC